MEPIRESNKRLLAEFAVKERKRIVELAASGQLVELVRMAEQLGVTPQAVLDAEATCRIFSLEGINGKLYPAFYASTRLNRVLLEAVSSRLDRLPGASKWQFFTTPRLSLGGKTPIEALEAGENDLVVAAAAAFMEG
ncbi:hypothetical protein [Duganella vulcania]|uniref:Uncharacterized protein n=1 Tax=Duganella vulcania TaxID=2692166 RepID=A0A845GG81_9BURK|nr:hypothetical protein [Duganella vulcania]MYM92520.1 hypothetical protein [Duganella vulcania]